MSIKENLNKIRQLVEKSSNPKVQLVAVTKYADTEQIFEAYEAGVRIFGENYVIPALEKMKELKPRLKEKVEWHLIGRLQKNKVKKAVGEFDLIQSVNTVGLARLIAKVAEERGITQKVLLQVNTTDEDQKNGFSPEALKKALLELKEIKSIDIRGLMTMGPSDSKKIENIEEAFGTLRELGRQLERVLVSGPCELSMGMSQDFQMAIDQGSTMIRIGTALFDGLKERR